MQVFTDAICVGCGLTAAVLLPLDRWALHGTVGAEDAAVAGPGAQDRIAIAALVEELAGVRRHGFLACEPALRAGEHGRQYGISH
jgi:hypothetical protein